MSGFVEAHVKARKPKHDNQGRSKPRYLALWQWLLQSPAWKALGPVDRALYVEIAQRYNGSNNGLIPYSVREGAEALSLGLESVYESLRRLVALGFLKRATEGSFDYKVRHSTRWQLTEHVCDATGKAATKTFMSYTEEDVVRVLEEHQQRRLAEREQWRLKRAARKEAKSAATSSVSVAEAKSGQNPKSRFL